jgi:4-amino-4-deoxy-L-arabinose transferase-like glycosyltransferase
MTDSSTPFSSARRFLILGVILSLQTVYFAALGEWPPQVVADNTRYEGPAWNLAQGRGLTIAWPDFKDPTLRDAACARVPDACQGELYPTASYPPGYQFFLAAVYFVAGRNLWVVEAVQLGLLLVMFVLFERMAFRLLRRDGYIFSMLIAAMYPFLARQASRVMGDHHHSALLLAGVACLVLMTAGARRGIAAGLLLGLATFVRPYSLFAVAAALAIPEVRRNASIRSSELLAAVAAFAAPFVPWTVRNWLVFGKFIPLSASGLGYGFFLNQIEARYGSALRPEVQALINERSAQMGEYLAIETNQQLTRAGVAWVLSDPLAFLSLLPGRVFRVWVSLGYSGEGYSKAAILLAAFLGGLLLLGLLGMFRVARQGSWSALAIIIIVYWAFLLISPSEARRTLPLRLPLLLFAGAAIDWAVPILRARRPAARRTPR